MCSGSPGSPMSAHGEDDWYLLTVSLPPGEYGYLVTDAAGTHPDELNPQRTYRGDEEVSLSAKEFSLLEVFMRRPGEVLSRFQLLEHAWDYDYENRSNVVDVYVRYLRKKIGAEAIETVRGAGYRLRKG